jgi:pimeloyl-ACP methyl ester carboxylesterase
MHAGLTTKAEDKFVVVDGLKMRYIEAGSGPIVLLLHGASLGSSADVFQRNLPPFAEAGFRAIAFDFPGFGRSEGGADLSLGFQRNALLRFMAALDIQQAALMAHSRAGNYAVQLGLQEPTRFSHIVILGTGSLLPPLEGDVEGRYAGVQERVDRELAQTEPTIEDTRRLMQADLFHTELVTQDELERRHRHSIGKNFQIFVERSHNAAAQGTQKKPLWQRFGELRMPLMLVFGLNDRAHAGDRAKRLKAMQPELNLHIVENCKHMVPWDAYDEINQLTVPFLKGP